MSRGALRIAKTVADETGPLLAGDICNTNIYAPADKASHKAARAMFEEQVGWAVEAGVDFIVAETFSYAAEAKLALEVIKAAGQPAVVTRAIHRTPDTRDGMSPEDRCKRPADDGSDGRGP